ncbi:ABC transporter substrate-binding protein [Tropicibacter sp. R15_0]|uniref:heme/hemin ABC transporter substrate-binding protein n=1 Tax=Tropicibacter sp. R15_0 TaxID=2821101 RepID=UPI001ADA9C45|nr:ABC transporter substrate-binding protein [Tropicibacter sp. R15_0]MBO9467827.1 ABC transporter substrate-binding protein [Tropicibacter sp. R15_0]
MTRRPTRGLMAVWIALFGAFIAWQTSAQEHANQPAKDADILSLGGTVTEIIYALGQGERILARDSTSTFPLQAQDLPDVGYLRRLSPEGVLSTGASLIIAEQGAGPAEAMDVIKAADVAFVEVADGFTAEAVIAKITTVGAALGTADAADTLAAEVQAAFDATESAIAKQKGARKRVMFLLSAGGGKLMVGGQDTSADAIIRLAGADNAAKGMSGFKPLTDEAAAAAAPDVILMMDRGGHPAMSADELFSMPALSITPAGEAKRLITMNGLKLLGFGPRAAEAAQELHGLLYDQ